MSAHQENSTSRTKLSTIIVRTDYLGDAKMRALIAIHGINAAALWLPFQTCIASQGGASRELLILQGLGFGISSEATEDILNTAIKIGLFYVDGDLVFSESVDVDVANVEQKRQQWREKKRGQRSAPPTVPLVSPGTNGGVPHLSEEENEYEDEEEKEQESKKIHTGTTPAPASEDAPPVDPILRQAEERLDKPNGQPWTNSNAWIGAGRRPMRDFPLIFLTPHELARAIVEIRKSVPTEDIASVFHACEAHLRGKSPQQRDSISHFNTLTTWCLNEVIEKATKRQRGKNSGVPVAPIVRAPQQQSAGPPSVAESDPRVSDEKAKEFIQKLKEATRCAKSMQ